MLIELLTFRLVAGADETAFLEADARVQQLFFPHQPGAIRRTTARGIDGEWLVVTLWWSGDEADAAARAADGDATYTAFEGFIENASLRRFQTLD
jgi:hypothetical protein